ncbi:MAG: B12-binding domain-containing radical SAM protein [Nitrospirae bacterium]|nr:B12-binding domain-containing radical SAM protein [Nitrospirota bacterium]
MKCLLISLQSNAYVTGLKYIAANIHANSHEARILLLPGYLEPTLSPAIEDFIRDYNPDLIGIGLMSIEFYPAKNITRLLRERFQTPIIWGGVHVSTYPEECIKYADYVCRGEGESAVVSLLEHLRNKGKDVPPNIPNIWVRCNGKIIKQSVSSLETNLDNLPFQEYLPDYYYGFHNGKIYNFAKNPHLFRRYALYSGTCHMMITTRGCPFNCSYCGHTALIAVYGRKVRERAVENCMEELKAVKKDPYVLYINFEDDCFFVHSREWIRKFSEKYKKHINLPFIVRAIPTLLEREKLFMLKDAGLSMIVMGIQSGSDRVNFEIYDRRINFSSVMKAAELISEAKAVPFYEMIVDNPYETEETEMETIDSMSKLRRPYIISLAHLTFFPGTPLTEKAIKDNITTRDSSLYTYMPTKFNETYLNKLLRITPYIPRFLVRYLNKSVTSRRQFHLLLTNILYFTVRMTIEPAIFMFLISRSVNYNIKLTIRTLIGNWRPALSKLIFNYLGKKDLEYTERLISLRKTTPALFEKD